MHANIYTYMGDWGNVPVEERREGGGVEGGAVGFKESQRQVGNNSSFPLKLFYNSTI